VERWLAASTMARRIESKTFGLQQMEIEGKLRQDGSILHLTSVVMRWRDMEVTMVARLKLVAVIFWDGRCLKIWYVRKLLRLDGGDPSFFFLLSLLLFFCFFFASVFDFSFYLLIQGGGWHGGVEILLTTENESWQNKDNRFVSLPLFV